ncbi:williams-beuren syndrome critical region protein, putative [Schistosoma mansoni]|uniref:williams-beuren syndrome critical region protein, putative n=1 Tax=Schistosoma mansoni TaxID=6183 RepID=UPI00022C8787|nr:williams-beuren syndrome critical region protein, putative [Schistosoma mansoni]|eukprot:XP_018646625.1 williams-beuren syndrome critical region protein, putative [Schistosoma mansoni]
MKNDLSILYTEAAYLVCLVKGQVCRLKTGLYTHNFTCNLRKIYALASKTLNSYGILLQTLKKANLQPTTKIKHLSSKSNHNNKDNDVHSCIHCYFLVLIHDLLIKEKKTSHHFLLSQIHEVTKDALATKKLRHAYQSVNKLSKSQTENRGQNKGLLPCYARVNFLKTKLADVIEKLETCGFKQVKYDRSETSYRKFRKKVCKLDRGEFMLDYHLPHLLLVFPSGTALYDLELYKSKSLLIQDKASCFGPEILQPDPNSDVLDACAAPGNKTLQLISMLSNKSTIFVVDRDPNSKHKKSIQSSQPSIEAYCSDFLSIDPYHRKFSNVQSILLDPSCSGSGLSIRQPDGGDEQFDKFTHKKSDNYIDVYSEEYSSRLKRLSNLQAMLLKHAFKFPNVQRVVYSTCSIHPEENESVVREIANYVSDKFYLETIWPYIPSSSSSTSSTTNSMMHDVTTPIWKHRGLSDLYQCESCIRSSEKDLTNGFFIALFIKYKSNNSLNVTSSSSAAAAASSSSSPSSSVVTTGSNVLHNTSILQNNNNNTTASIVVNSNNENMNLDKQELFTFKIRKKCRTNL